MRWNHLLFVIFLIALAGCGGKRDISGKNSAVTRRNQVVRRETKQEGRQEIHLPVRTVRITRKIFYRTYMGYGSLQSNRTTDLVTQFDGIVHLNLKRNGRYKKGDLIFSLAGPAVEQKRIELSANLKSAKAQFQLVQKKLKRGTVLKKQDLLSVEKWQELQQDFNLARQAFQKSKSNWNFFRTMTHYHAPYDGILSGWSVSQGDYVQVGTPVARFLDVSRPKLVINYVGNLTFLKKSARMTVFLDDSLQTTGHVIWEAPAVEAGMGGHQLWIALDSLKSALVPGMFVKFLLQFNAHHALAVPEEALVRQGSHYFVVVEQNDSYENQPVKIGNKKGAFRELLEGPPVGTRVVTTSAFEYFYKNLRETMKVKD